MGLSLFLAALGVFFRDIAQIIGLVMTALMFLAPITYPLSAIPKEYLWVISSNPLTPFVEMTRGSLVLGLAPPLGDLTIAFAIALVALSIGSWVFWKTRRSFADLL
jgi:lipopolysaccharide transport system permease protein